MAHPQSSPRGYVAKQRIDVAGAQATADTTGNLRLNAGLALSGETTDIITQNSTALLLAGGLALSGETTDVITQNSTAVAMPSGLTLKNLSAAPATRYAPGSAVFVTNSTGSMIALNTTGTTWTYCNVTSVLA